MGEGRWTLAVDRQGMEIASDQFQLRTSGLRATQMRSAASDIVLEVVDAGEMEAIVSELESMTRRTYGQYSPLSRVMETIGQRWAMLIIRDLLVSARGFNDLRRGLPRVPSDVLTARLRELEHVGIVQSVPAGDDVLYELTDYGLELDEIVLRLGRWGARVLGEPRQGEIVTTDSLIMALRAIFEPDNARGVRASYEIRMGDIVLHARVDDGTLRTGAGPLPGAGLVMAPGTALKDLVSGKLSSAEALASGAVRVSGDPALLELFTRIFRMPAPPAQVS